MRIKKSTLEESQSQVTTTPTTSTTTACSEVITIVESPAHAHEHAENTLVIIEKKKRGRKKLIKPDSDIHDVSFVTTNVIIDVDSTTNSNHLNGSNDETISKEKNNANLEVQTKKYKIKT